MKSDKLIVLIALLSLLSSQTHRLLAVAASVDNCPIASRQQFKRYFFLPNCSRSLSLGPAPSLACAIAAALSPVPSAAVLSDSGATCHVTAALCPRYQLCSLGCPSAVLMPASLVALEHVVLSVRSGCGHSVWDLMTRNAAGSAFAVQPAHPEAATLPDTFRSGLLDEMQRLISGLIYKQFIVQLYRNSSVAVRLVFDVGSSVESLTGLNWFRQERLVESWPVTDLASRDTNFFSIEGDVLETRLTRRFFVNFYYNGCPNDRGLMAVIDKSDPCPFWAFSGPAPIIVYNLSPSKTWATSTTTSRFLFADNQLRH